MSRTHYFLICLSILITSCNGQSSPTLKLYNKDFKWTITIPEDFEKVESEQWKKMQNKGAEAIEKTYNKEIVNEATVLFVFKSGATNYLEANYQPFDEKKDGSYIENWKAVNEVLYHTFQSQMPNTKVDTTTTIEKIDNLDFQKFIMKVAYPNNMILNILMYSRLIKQKEFTVNIMYVDPKKGEQLLAAWKASKFDE